LRIHRHLEELLDRQAAAGEGARLDALAAELRDALRGLRADERSPVLALLQRLTPQAPVATPTAHSGPSARELELEDEVARLKAERDARPAPASSSPELVAGLAKAIGLSTRDVTAAAGDPAGQARLAAVVGTLVDFAVSLLRAYIPVTEDEDRSVAKMVNGLVADAVTGRNQGAELSEQVERTRRQIGGQVVAFRKASDNGARAMLKVLSPAVIEAEASRGASFLEKRFGIAAQCWELFGRRFEELRASPDLYQTHFDGPLRREMHQLAQGRRGSQG
jgi:hypothetical protein